MTRAFAGGIAGFFVTSIVIAILLFGPRSEAKFQPIVHQQLQKKDGVYEKSDMMGLVQLQWFFEDGYPQGLALHYYPNGSLHRELVYRDGMLQGTVKEYYEKAGHRHKPPREALAYSEVRKAISGPLKAGWQYRDGVLDGPYTLYRENGEIKEQGQYVNGKREKYNP